MQNYNDLPPNLPRPVDDGLTDHLKGHPIPDFELPSTDGKAINLKTAFQNPTILFIYPRAGSPLEPNTNQDLWDSMPGARGCTPQSCGFRDLSADFQKLGVAIYGLSIQSSEVQKEFVHRMHIPFQHLSDEKRLLTASLNLPTFTFEGESLIKRMALFIENGTIQKVFYPVFPPNKNAEEVLYWLNQNR